MIKKTTLKSAVAVAALASGLGTSLSAGTFTGYTNDPKQVITTYGGDFKLRIDTFINDKCWAALSAAEQDTVVAWVNELNLDVIRIPIYAVSYPTDPNDTTKGIFDATKYDNVKKLMAKFSGKTFFASPNENGEAYNSWPDWVDGKIGVQDGGSILPGRYNDWLTKSLNTLGQTATVTHLGCFNEDGTIPESIKWKVYNNYPGKTRVGTCSWSLSTTDEALNTVVVTSTGKKLVDYIEIPSAHAYDHKENYFEAYHQEWNDVKNTAPSKPLWASEATGWSVGIDAGASYYFNAMKGNVDGIIQYQVLGQIIQFKNTTTVQLKPRDGVYYALKGIIGFSKGRTRIGSTLSSMPDSRGVVFKASNTKYYMMVARPNNVSHTYALSSKVITGVKRFEYTDTTAADPVGTTVNVPSGGANFTDTSSAPLVIYEVTVQ